MEKENARQKPDKAVEVGSFLAQRWSWLGFLFVGRQGDEDVRILGFRASWSETGWLLVVYGLHLVEVKRVVAFGQGPTLYQALNNVTTAIRKGQWRADKYKSLI